MLPTVNASSPDLRVSDCGIKTALASAYAKCLREVAQRMISEIGMPPSTEAQELHSQCGAARQALEQHRAGHGC
jgi:hypothetical protein